MSNYDIKTLGHVEDESCITICSRTDLILINVKICIFKWNSAMNESPVIYNDKF